MTEQTIVAVYDTPAHAELAVQDLLQANVPEQAIHRHAREGSYAGSSTSAAPRTENTGFWSSLFGGEPDHDTAVYDRSVSGGSNAVTVRVPDEHVAAVTAILESHAPIDIDERAGSYGLTQMGATGTGATQARATQAAAAPAGTAARADTRAGAGDDRIQLSEETLAVGKRVVNRGTTRIRRFVVETPVEEKVRLHDETVTIERRPVTDGRPVTDSFSDRTIAVTESGEEAVVSKTARVVEEIGIRKEAADRTETVRDTVRREDVEITKLAGEPGGSTYDTTTRKTGV